MGKVGISIYPEHTTIKEDEEYLKLAKKLGFSRVFTSFLQLNLDNIQESMRRFKESIGIARNLGFEIIVDVHPFVFKYLKIDCTDLKYFYDLGVSGIRLDKGFTGREEAIMTRNPYDLKIEINMSNYNHYLNQILDYNPNKENLIASHNFYPQRYTGLSNEHFEKCSRRFKENNIRTAAFVTSQVGEISPWPVQEGLCTLEHHRDLPIDVQVRDLAMTGLIDDIIIANLYASEAELELVAKCFFSKIDAIKVETFEDITDLEKKILFENIQTYRGDFSEYVIRSTKGRLKYTKESIPKKKVVRDINFGDILILNDEYGQYKGEVQIALKPRSGDERINVVGRVNSENITLVDKLKIYQDFMIYE
ncbi:MupG family TIM beta-alpha barrel fold protein [Clostridium sp.]|uniref:DUF871 domain-containing protein n=1 Tax=Clostridium sp. TaxID=1506 RepID=UPI0025C074D8|nr:MupG family TIM beta-alpha barrel fold protein [Clostridium sp.]